MTARPTPTLCLAALLALAGTSALAQHGAAPAHAPAAAASAAAPAATVEANGVLVENAPGSSRDAKIEHLVTEDSQVRIEETRVRGVTEKIVVHSKLTGGSYEIQPKDPSQAPENDKADGMRKFTWGF